MNTLPRRITAKEARDNFTDLLGTVYYGKEAVVVEKQGRPFAVVINPNEYENYQTFKQAARKRLLEIVEEIQAANKGVSYEEVLEDVTTEVEAVRKERYARQKKLTGSD